MKMKRSIWVTGVAVMLAASSFGVPAAAAPAGDEAAADSAPRTGRAVCEHRLCLYVLDDSSDSDGDGVTDVDELALGTNAEDPGSYPDVTKILDLALARELPSFEAHLTELVALPKDLPNGTELSTAFGAVDKPEQGDYVQSVDGLLRDLAENGFEQLGTNMTVTLTRKPSLSQDAELAFAGLGNIALYGNKGEDGFEIEGLVGPTIYGVNGQKQPTGIFEDVFSYDRADSILRQYLVGYTDGSFDSVSTSTTSLPNFRASKTEFASYGESGKKFGNTVITTESKSTVSGGGVSNTQTWGSQSTDGSDAGGGSSHADWWRSETRFSDGSTASEGNINNTNYGNNGKVTEKTEITTRKDADGTTWVNEMTDYYDSDGNLTGTVVKSTEMTPDGTSITVETHLDADGNVIGETVEETKPEPCEGDGCEAEDPHSITYAEDTGMGPITDADMARTIAC